MSEQAAGSARDPLLMVGIIHRALLHYFLGTNEVHEVSLQRESCPSLHVLPSTYIEQHILPLRILTGHAVISYVLFLTLMGLWLWA